MINLLDITTSDAIRGVLGVAEDELSDTVMQDVELADQLELDIEDLKTAIADLERRQAPKRRPIFIRDPGRKTSIAVVDVDAYGNQDAIECADPEAASHWDARQWHKLR